MLKHDVCKLISEEYTTDEIGQRIAEETENQVFCVVGSVSRSEWFQAGQAGLSPAYVLTIFSGDYNDEKICEYDGKRFGIYRTYAKDTDNIELYLEQKGGV